MMTKVIIMVKKKESIPALIYRGTPVGYGAIPSGSIYSGQLLRISGWGVLSGADYSVNASAFNKVVPIMKAISASEVGASGTQSGTQYGVVGVAIGDAPIQSQYQQLAVGKPLAAPTNVTQYEILTDTDVRRFAFATPNDAIQLWLPYSGSTPSAGDYLALSSGVDGAVQVSANPFVDFTVGQIMGYQQAANFSGTTVPLIDAYVLTILTFKYGWNTA